MKIVYVAHVRLPTEKAHGIQIMKMCEAFARLGHDVELVVPTRRTPIEEDAFSYYGVERNFTVTYVSVPDTGASSRAGFLFAGCMFGWKVRRRIAQSTPDIIYGRDELPLLLAAGRSTAAVLWETHTGAWNVFARVIIRRCRVLVAISNGLKEFYIGHGVDGAKIVVAHDGIDLADYERVGAQSEARSRLGLPQEGRVVLYAGALDGWKGVDTLLQASVLLPEDLAVAIVGGTPAQVESLSREYPKVRFLGYRPYRELPTNLSAANVLVLPNTGTQEVSARFTSPLKLFAYMASGKPIVASDLPSIREVLTDESAVLVAPDDAAALAAGVMRVCTDAVLAGTFAREARNRVEDYSWSGRAERVLSSVGGEHVSNLRSREIAV